MTTSRRVTPGQSSSPDVFYNAEAGPSRSRTRTSDVIEISESEVEDVDSQIKAARAARKRVEKRKRQSSLQPPDSAKKPLTAFERPTYLWGPSHLRKKPPTIGWKDLHRDMPGSLEREPRWLGPDDDEDAAESTWTGNGDNGRWTYLEIKAGGDYPGAGTSERYGLKRVYLIRKDIELLHVMVAFLNSTHEDVTGGHKESDVHWQRLARKEARFVFDGERIRYTDTIDSVDGLGLDGTLEYVEGQYGGA